MKVAIVTPYYRESIQLLRRCHDSVKAQTYPDVTHIMVADGHPNPVVEQWDCEHVVLSASHQDAGATPRALAAMSAFARGYDAVGFLDADNSIDPDHVAQMVSIVRSQSAQFVAATRRIHCWFTGRELYADFIESNGDYLTDTNCMFLTKDCAPLLPRWISPPDQALATDRIFWGAVKHSGVRISRCLKPTVMYATRWAFHFGTAGVDVPDDALWFRYADPARTSIRRDNKGRIRHADLTEEQQEEALRLATGHLKQGDR